MCGIFAVYNSTDAAKEVYYGLHAIQHRAQKSGGIIASDGFQTYCHVGYGIIVDVFNELRLRRLHGRHAIGQVRYATVKDNPELENIQPIRAPAGDYEVSLAHNGNLTNAEELREKLADGKRWRTSLDTEIFLRQFCTSRAKAFPDRVFDTVWGVQGSYSLVIMYGDLMAAVRDPYGNRPLWIGKRNGSYFFASETVSLDNLEAEIVREVEPGEIVVVKDGVLESWYFDEAQVSFSPLPRHKRAHCVFELLYFAHPASNVFGDVGVEEFQQRAGELLAKKYPAPTEHVVPVPDSACYHAEGFAYAAGTRVVRGITRSHYIGRTFIEPDQTSRISAVVKKFAFIGRLLRGKSIVLIDDSIVRLNTMLKIVGALKRRGVEEIHVRIPTPPICYECYHGIDMPERSELVMASSTKEEVQERLGVASLEFLTVPELQSLLPNPQDYCFACMTGEYPMGTPKAA